MSNTCSICLGPFTACPRSAKPRDTPPKGLLTREQYVYLNGGISINPWAPGGPVSRVESCSGNLFGGVGMAIVSTIAWESESSRTAEGGSATIMMCHTVCGDLLRHLMDAEEDSVDSFKRLLEVEHALGPAQGGKTAGRLNYVQYELVSEKVKMRRFWISREGHGMNAFNWALWEEEIDSLGWTLARPDVFPRFFTEVAQKRIPPPRDPAVDPKDVFSTKPMDLLHILLPYLSNESFVRFMSLSTSFRRLAMNPPFQAHARNRVLALKWATPLVPARAGLAKHGLAYAGDDKQADGGDWLLYLSHVHRTKPMRARRWIWSLCVEIHKTAMETLEGTALMDETSEERKNFDQRVEQSFDMGLMMKGQKPRFTKMPTKEAKATLEEMNWNSVDLSSLGVDLPLNVPAPAAPIQ